MLLVIVFLGVGDVGQGVQKWGTLLPKEGALLSKKNIVASKGETLLSKGGVLLSKGEKLLSKVGEKLSNGDALLSEWDEQLPKEDALLQKEVAPLQNDTASPPGVTSRMSRGEDGKKPVPSIRRSRRSGSLGSPEWKADAPGKALPPTQGQWRHPGPDTAGDTAGGVGFETGLGEGNISVAYRHVSLSMANFPDPRDDPRRCHRPRPSTVCDPTGVLSEEQGKRVRAPGAK